MQKNKFGRFRICPRNSHHFQVMSGDVDHVVSRSLTARVRRCIHVNEISLLPTRPSSSGYPSASNRPDIVSYKQEKEAVCAALAAARKIRTETAFAGCAGLHCCRHPLRHRHPNALRQLSRHRRQRVRKPRKQFDLPRLTRSHRLRSAGLPFLASTILVRENAPASRSIPILRTRAISITCSMTRNSRGTAVRAKFF